VVLGPLFPALWWWRPGFLSPTQSYCSSLDGGDDDTVPLDGGHVGHTGKVINAVADDDEDKLGYSSLAIPCVYNPVAIWFFFLSSPPWYTCSSLVDDAVVLLLLVDGPVVVTGAEGSSNFLILYII
jgi:hypothetical protein